MGCEKESIGDMTGGFCSGIGRVRMSRVCLGKATSMEERCRVGVEIQYGCTANWMPRM